MNFKKFTRLILAYFLYLTGLLSAIIRIRLHRKAVVLMYHRVLTNTEYLTNFFMNGIVVRAETFEKQMKYLAKNFHIVSPEDFLAHMEKKITFETKSCLVTFDDGWKDNYKNALPILTENKIPALVFLTTGFIGTHNHFWQTRLIQSLCSLRAYVTQNSAQQPDKLPAMKIDEISRIVHSSDQEFREKVLAFAASQKKEDVNLIEEKIALLKKRVQSQDEEESGGGDFLDWKEIEAMEQEGVWFGSHGISHRILPTLEAKEVEKEVSSSKEFIDDKLGKDAWAFSYPNGDCSKAAVDAVRKSGYKLAFTTESGPVSSRDDPYRIKRRNIFEDMTDSIPMFLARVVGLW